MPNKIKVMILGTGNATNKFIINNSENEFIEIVGIILDTSVSKENRELFMCELNRGLSVDISVYDFNSENLKLADVIFAPEYRKIIPKELTDNHFIINCHGGILPKWRGFSANAWAIMNGEKEIGFSIHRVRAGLDNGEIYYVKHILINNNQTYADVHDEMVNAICKDVPKVLFDIVKGNLHGIVQPNSGFAYCNKFNASMGDISGFENDSQYYVNLYRCMSKPLGTGVWFTYNGKKFNVNLIEHGKIYGIINYMGINGKIVNICDEKLWVKTRDNVVVLSKIEYDRAVIMPCDIFKIGNKI